MRSRTNSVHDLCESTSPRQSLHTSIALPRAFRFGGSTHRHGMLVAPTRDMHADRLLPLIEDQGVFLPVHPSGGASCCRPGIREDDAPEPRPIEHHPDLAYLHAPAEVIDDLPEELVWIAGVGPSVLYAVQYQRPPGEFSGIPRSERRLDVVVLVSKAPDQPELETVSAARQMSADMVWVPTISSKGFSV